jgi:polysaccharide biosynthesis protein PslF
MKQHKIGFLSTYPPKACGIATFTQDLVRSLDQCLDDSPVVIAVNNSHMAYSNRVVMEIQQQDRTSYQKAANKLNQSSLDAIVLEHEYGIFGGENGEYILDFADRLKLPLITTFHTVLPSPLEKQRYILEELGRRSEKVITMANVTKKMLENIYHIPAHKIEVIPHGVSVQSQQLSPDALKAAFGLNGHRIISTFGLLSPGKGLEYGIKAIAKIALKYPDIVYLILGQTHPCVKEINGEAYRKKLEELVYQLDVKEQVKFVNRYLSKEEIGQYLSLSDIYLTPYLDRNQAVSGTLAYAVGYGKMIISTPYLYAREILAEGRGLLADFGDEDSMAGQIDAVLTYPKKTRSMEAKTAILGKTMMWENVAGAYAELFQKIIGRAGKESLVG